MTRAVLAWTMDKLNQGYSVAIATIIDSKGSVPGKPGAKLALIKNGEKYGTVGGAGLELKIEIALTKLLNESKPMSSKGGEINTFLLYKDGKGKEVIPLDSLCGGQVRVAMEVIDSMPHILIVGGGHVGLAIALASDTLGWAHSVFDVREDYANSDRFPFAEEIHNYSIDEFLKNEDNDSLNRFSDILLLGHDWSLDQDMLIGILSLLNIDSRSRLGAIGSKSKWSAFKKAALGSNIQQSLIDATRCPIGLSIGAHSPEEIAIAVCAEIISFEKLHNDSEE